MQVSVENTSSLGRTIKVVVPKDVVATKRKEKIAKVAKEVKLKGFRNKVPHSVVEKKFGASIKSEVYSDLIQTTFSETLMKEKLNPVGQPQFKDIKTEDELSYTAEFEIHPEIKLADFSTYELEAEKAEVTEEDVTDMVKKLCSQHANWDVVSEAAKKDNRLKVDFTRTFIEEGAATENEQHKYLILGSEGILKEINEALVGKKAGDSVELTVSYPEDWADKVSAGKQAKLKVDLHEVAVKKELSEEELVKLFGMEKAEQMHEQLKQKMEEEVKTAVFAKTKEAVLEKLLETHEVELPKTLVEQEMNKLKQQRARKPDGSVDVNAKVEDVDVQDDANRSVKLGLILNAVKEKFELKADAKSVAKAIERIALQFPDPNKIAQAYYGNERLLNGIENQVVLDISIEKIIDSAKVKETVTSFAKVIERAEETVE